MRKKNKIPQEPLQAEITGLSHEGRGIANLNGKTHFIFGALPGETVTFKLTAVHGKYNEGRTLSVNNPSQDRVEPRCPHFGICGGCSLQHLQHDAQLALKQKTVLEQIKYIGKITPQKILAPLIADPWGYRRQARLGVRFVIKKDKLLMGFREHDGRFMADLNNCEILDVRVGKNFEAIIDTLRSLKAYDHIAQVEVVIGDEQAALIIRHLVPLDATDLEKLIQLSKNCDYHIYLEPNKPEKIRKLWPDDQNDRLHYSIQNPHLRFEFKATDFTQINAKINAQMITMAMSLLDPQPTDTILDLFCGLGNFTLPLATKANHVTGVEGDAEMVIRGYDNAKLNQLSNLNFYAADLFKPLPPDDWAQKKYNKILLDPPRTGAQDLLKSISKFGAEKILYVSCNPATFARDSLELTQQGYVLDSLLIADMFTHTAHVETIGLFVKS